MQSALFTRIYVSSYGEILCMCFVYLLGVLWLHRRWCGKLRPVWAALLLTWAAVVLYMTVLSREPGGTYRVNCLPFHSYLELLAGGNREILRSCFMNGVLFFPAGVLTAVLFPQNWSARKRIGVAVCCLACFSLCIEYAQYHWALGHCEADDVLHNTLGATLGCLTVSFGTQNFYP